MGHLPRSNKFQAVFRQGQKKESLFFRACVISISGRHVLGGVWHGGLRILHEPRRRTEQGGEPFDVSVESEYDVSIGC